MNVVLYARVSSERQVEKDLSITAQLKALRKYARDRAWTIHREFVDEAESARSANRPSFKEMIAHAKQNQRAFDAILVWKLSRFARNREDSIIYKSLLRKHGVSVISINEQVDESPAGKLLEGVIEVIDEFYSTNLAQDTIRGMKENAARGFYNGGTMPVGYRASKVRVGAVEKTKLVPDEVYGPLVQRIFKLCVDGLGAKEIVKTLNGEGLETQRGKPWNKNKVYYILKNEVYTGTLIWNSKEKSRGPTRPKGSDDVVRIRGNHPALIDQKTFDQVQRLLQARAPKVRNPRTINSGYILSGMVKCGKCGAAMIGCAAKSSRYFYYGCRNHSRVGKHVCDAKLVSKPRLESFVLDRIKDNILTEENLRELVRLVNEEIRTTKQVSGEQMSVIDGQIEELNGRLDRLHDALETGKLDLDHLAPRIKALRARIDVLEAKRGELRQRQQEPELELLSPAETQRHVVDLKSFLGSESVLKKKTFLRTFIKRIDVDLPQVAIDYTIPGWSQKKAEPLTCGVLPSDGPGSPGRTRTNNLSVNSRLLYH